MGKLLADDRRRVGEFEVVDFTDPARVSAIRSGLDVDCPTQIRWNDWEYGSVVEELRALYEKGKGAQWNATTDLDWSVPVTPREWLGKPEVSLLAFTVKQMGKDEATQKEALFDEINYMLSQVLHGEQAALQLCGQLTNLCPTTDEKLYAASQVADEARHAEVFARFLGEKMGTIYPISPMLKLLLDELLTAEGYRKKTLGMQTLFEGVAMALFNALRTNMHNPLLVDMIRRVEIDESRHAAFGVLTMRRVAEESSAEELAELEDWAFDVLETFNAGQNMDLLRTFGPKYGIDPKLLTAYVTGMPEFPVFNSEIYMHTVMPNLRRIGLVTERTAPRYRELGILYDAPPAG
jgi:1,2-phenylacetyl-CoA epoxidase catalytic subunit